MKNTKVRTNALQSSPSKAISKLMTYYKLKNFKLLTTTHLSKYTNYTVIDNGASLNTVYASEYSMSIILWLNENFYGFH